MLFRYNSIYKKLNEFFQYGVKDLITVTDYCFFKYTEPEESSL